MADEVMNEVVATTEFDPTKVYAQIIVEDDGYHVIDEDGTKGEVCKLVDDGRTIALTKNASNRKWFNKAKADAEIAEKGAVDLFYKASKTFGPQGSKLPNAKLIAYLSEEEQAEYAAIIERARAAKAADKKVPANKVDALKARLAKLQEQLAELYAMKAEVENEEE